jgi:hypothetical protein
MSSHEIGIGGPINGPVTMGAAKVADRGLPDSSKE